jgi:hypothetical protein
MDEDWYVDKHLTGMKLGKQHHVEKFFHNSGQIFSYSLEHRFRSATPTEFDTVMMSAGKKVQAAYDNLLMVYIQVPASTRHQYTHQSQQSTLDPHQITPESEDSSTGSTHNSPAPTVQPLAGHISQGEKWLKTVLAKRLPGTPDEVEAQEVCLCAFSLPCLHISLFIRDALGVSDRVLHSFFLQVVCVSPLMEKMMWV